MTGERTGLPAEITRYRRLADHRRDIGGSAFRRPDVGQHLDKRHTAVNEAAVTGTERHLAEIGHFALAGLVEDLAGFVIPCRRNGIRLALGEIAQHTERKFRRQPKRL
jgi:hypothetical protein